jgi:hypothetical protein
VKTIAIELTFYEPGSSSWTGFGTHLSEFDAGLRVAGRGGSRRRALCAKRTMRHHKATTARTRIWGEPADELDETIGNLAVAYSDQVERDYAALKAAVR